MFVVMIKGEKIMDEKVAVERWMKKWGANK
jgi:hypothetical protein